MIKPPEETYDYRLVPAAWMVELFRSYPVFQPDAYLSKDLEMEKIRNEVRRLRDLGYRWVRTDRIMVPVSETGTVEIDYAVLERLRPVVQS